MPDTDEQTNWYKRLKTDLDLSPMPVPIDWTYDGPSTPSEGSPISMEILIDRYRKGWTPERFCEEYPWQDLAETYLAIAFYLRNKETIDAYLIETQDRTTEH